MADDGNRSAAKEIPHTKIQTWFPRCRLTAGGVPSRSPILSARDAVARRSSRRSGGNRENATTDAILVAFLCVRVSRRVCGVCWRVLDRPRSAKCLVVSFRRPPAVWAIYNLPKKKFEAVGLCTERASRACAWWRTGDGFGELRTWAVEPSISSALPGQDHMNVNST